MKDASIEVLQRALIRERAAKKQAEKILEEKSLELFLLSQKHKESNILLQQNLQKRDLELEIVFENSNDAYVLIDEKGNIKNVNEHTIELFDLGEGHANINIADVIFHEDYESFEWAFTELFRAGVLRNFKVRILDSKGEITAIQVNATVIYDDEKNPIGAHGIVRNITEDEARRKQTEEQKEQLDIIIKNTPSGIILFRGITNEVLMVNDSLCEMLGYSENELFHLNGKGLTHEEDSELSSKYRASLERGEIDQFSMEKRYIKKDGSIVWAKMYAKSIKNKEGVVQYNIALIEDISLQREKKLMLNTINNIARSILGKLDVYDITSQITLNIAKYLQTSNCFVYLVDAKGKKYRKVALDGKKDIGNEIFSVDDGLVGEVIKTKNTILINDTSKDTRFLPSSAGVVRSQLTVPIINNESIIGVINIMHKDKNYFSQANLETIENISRIVSMQFKNAINIQELKASEERNKQLLKKLETSNNELQEYAHAVSHDLKSPLRSISSLLSWTIEDYGEKLNEEVISNINIIDSKVQLMDHLISGILEYSSVDWNSDKKDNVDVKSVIANILQVIHVPENMNIIIPDNLPIIKAHKLKIQQLFQNVLCNAIKYNDKPKGIIEIVSVETPEKYTFSIKDNGIGIDEKYHTQIFKIFNKLSNDEKSTGIGLSIVKKIVDLYNGEIWLESTQGVGTTFFFTITKLEITN